MSHATHEMHSNSLSAYATIPLNERRRAVLEAFYSWAFPMTDRDLAAFLKWDICSTRPRVTDCFKAGWIEERDTVREKGSRSRVRCCSITTAGIQKLKEIQ